MSRIGKLPIKIPAGVDITCDGPKITVKGKFGTLQNTIPDIVEIEQNDGSLIVSVKNQTRQARSLHGLYRTLINNMVIGVSEQFQLNLTLNGVGYRAAVQGQSIVLNLGYSHPVEMEIPEGLSIEVVKNTLLQKAMEKVDDVDYSELYEVLNGPTSLFFSAVGNAPAKLIQDFRKKSNKPVLKAAFVEETAYVRDDQLTTLSNIKSKDELIRDVIALLQSPTKNVVRSLQSGGNKLSGILKTLENRG